MNPPEKLIRSDGCLQPDVILLLKEHFGFSQRVLENTIYKQIRFQKNAITLYKYVFFDKKCFKKTEREWLLLIIHEQFHREEIGNHFLKAIGWYIGYLYGYMNAGFSYLNNPYEVRAYSFEAEAGRKLFENLGI